MIRNRSSEVLLAFALAALIAGGTGCTTTEDPKPDKIELPPISPQNVLKNLETSYRYQDIDIYGRLLADDFLFFFDPDTRDREQLPDFWNRFTDSTQTNLLFNSPDLIDARIRLTYNPNPVQNNESGREHWVYIDVVDTFLEIELGPTPDFEEGVTLLVDGQINRFYFRRGFTEGDTLAESLTSNNYYITEWRDRGAPAETQ